MLYVIAGLGWVVNGVVAMKSILPLLTLVAASSAFAQTAPNVAKKSPFQHSVELAYVTSSSSTAGLGFDDPSGYSLNGKVFVWKNLFLTLEYISLMTDAPSPSPGVTIDLDLSRFGYGLGGAFEVGPGVITASYTLGTAKIESDGFGDEEADQDRLSVGYSQAFGNGVTAGLSLVQFFNDGIDDYTAIIFSLGYDFRNGFSVNASFSPDSADLGVEEFTENVFSLGAKYSF